VVFWGSNFSFGSLVSMIAFRQLGLAVDCLSIPQHGFSVTRFGICYLNKICTGSENRFLRSRVVADPQALAGALQELSERLTCSGTVFFTVGPRGRRTAEADLLGARVRIATGPLAVAHQTGATLLPVYTLRTGAGRFEVTFGTPIDLRGGAEMDYDRALQAYADELSTFVLRDPGQWRGWHFTKAWGPW
jgi:lauroyl/myristoyl acyltransferase